MADGAPQREAREEIHLPGPSLLPLFAAVGLTLALMGLIVGWWMVVLGGVIALVTAWVWIRVVRREIRGLPTEHR